MQKINPNRMELSNQKKKLKVAVRGHKLLKDKQDALIKMFLEKVHQVRALRAEIEKELQSAYASFLIARSGMDKFTGDSIFLASSVTVQLMRSLVNNMGVKSPAFEFAQHGNLHAYGLVGTSGELDTALEIFSGVLQKMVKLSEMEKMVEMMALEIEKTRRRVNALEYRLIPETNEIIRFIKMKLDEMERSNLSRLMKVKDIVRKE
ncbi:MAG: V-type ATP synthase subunit D [Spirochaetes bacterium GWF1_49_6]|nr:MAG: V-type ATP synthase subunit D [Spirochaetes bacterium GWF1_49_6]